MNARPAKPGFLLPGEKSAGQQKQGLRDSQDDASPVLDKMPAFSED
jgi:hypothetical protein